VAIGNPLGFEPALKKSANFNTNPDASAFSSTDWMPKGSVMQVANVPVLGWRYWAMISIASVFGANMGDYAAHNLHLGHIDGIPVLAIMFGAVLFAERRARIHTEVFYWLAIVLLRTAATNLGDLTTHDMRLPPQWVVGALAALMMLILWVVSRADNDQNRQWFGTPPTNARFWVLMLLAGTLGTVFGDFVAARIGLAASTALFVTLWSVVLTFGRHAVGSNRIGYWLTIILIRTAGTNMGDFLTDGDGFGLPLPISTAVTGMLLLAAVLLWKPKVGVTLSANVAE